MKATLTFDLPEEADAHDDAINGTIWKGLAGDIDEQCRSWLKHGHSFTKPAEPIEYIRRMILEGQP